jgi:hypothetical protein
VQRLGRKARFEDDRPQHVKRLTERRDRVALLGVGRPELAEQTPTVFANPIQPAQLTVEGPQLVVEMPQHLTEPARVIDVNRRMALRDRLNLGNPLGERHPQTVVVVRPPARSTGSLTRPTPKAPRTQHGDLALKPLPRVAVKRHRSGHHASHDRRGTKPHQHIASRMDDDHLVQLQPAPRRHRAGGRHGMLFESAGHSEQSRKS